MRRRIRSEQRLVPTSSVNICSLEKPYRKQAMMVKERKVPKMPKSRMLGRFLKNCFFSTLMPQ